MNLRFIFLILVENQLQGKKQNITKALLWNISRWNWSVCSVVILSCISSSIRLNYSTVNCILTESSLFLKLTLDKERTFLIPRFHVSVVIKGCQNPSVVQTFSLCFVFGWQICSNFVILIVLLIKKTPGWGLWFKPFMVSLLFRGIKSRAEVFRDVSVVFPLSLGDARPDPWRMFATQ